MTIELNATHNPALTSWVESANLDGADFPIQNLPFGVIADGGRAGGAVAIGDRALPLAALADTGLLDGGAASAAAAGAGATLEPLLAASPADVSALRASLSALLRTGSEAQAALAPLLRPLDAIDMRLPMKPGAFTDFCASAEHIRRMGAATGNPPKMNWFALPVAYNGRASSVAVSGTPVVRPRGQFELPPGSGQVRYGPEPMLDFELEFGAWLRGGNALGETISVAEAEDLMFGCCLVNDWSARGIQFFETMLGPHLGKSFVTTASPWIVTMEALAPFRVAARGRTDDEPPIAEHLHDATDRERGAIAIELTADLAIAGGESKRIVTTDFRGMFWTLAQMVAHQASGGAPLELGDLVASGTVSGAADDAKACMAEITARGTTPILFDGGAKRTMLDDGDTLTIRGRAHADGYRSIGFGDCAGTIQPAR